MFATTTGLVIVGHQANVPGSADGGNKHWIIFTPALVARSPRAIEMNLLAPRILIFDRANHAVSGWGQDGRSNSSKSEILWLMILPLALIVDKVVCDPSVIHQERSLPVPWVWCHWCESTSQPAGGLVATSGVEDMTGQFACHWPVNSPPLLSLPPHYLVTCRLLTSDIVTGRDRQPQPLQLPKVTWLKMAGPRLTCSLYFQILHFLLVNLTSCLLVCLFICLFVWWSIYHKTLNENVSSSPSASFEVSHFPGSYFKIISEQLRFISLVSNFFKKLLQYR